MRITKHPILPVETGEEITFFFNGKLFKARRGEVISSALFANGIAVFGHHSKDKSPQGIFCANGQCSQCSVIADGLPVKSCVTAVNEGMRVESLEKLPSLPELENLPAAGEVNVVKPDVFIVGAGPAGMMAAIELGKLGAKVLLVDDKHRPGGKLVLQTHKFFGSSADCYAGMRGIGIASELEKEIGNIPSVETWLNSVAIGVFSDKKAGVLKGKEYVLVEPKTVLVAAGARERSLVFPGNTLPGVYGAGAFQTLVNRDLVKPSRRLFIIGGGNVGLIAGYHALQAGIEVVGLIEVLPQVGGYKVHADKLQRLGVPIYCSHAVIGVEGNGKAESITIAEVTDNFKPKPGTEKTFAVDTVLVAVGLNPIDELYRQAVSFGMKAFVAGDAEEIAEASAAIFSGKITGLKIAASLGLNCGAINPQWEEKMKVLKAKPGKISNQCVTTHVTPAQAGVQPADNLDSRFRGNDGGEQLHKSAGRKANVRPIFHCFQEIPCDPCVSACPKHSIRLTEDQLTALPRFEGECTGCAKCVATCPGLAITLVDYRKDKDNPLVTIAFEIGNDLLAPGQEVTIVSATGETLGQFPVAAIRDFKINRTLLVSLKIPAALAPQVAGIRLQGNGVRSSFVTCPGQVTNEDLTPLPQMTNEDLTPSQNIVCRCERVTAEKIKEAVKSGVTDFNQLKAITRAGMGACGGRTCEPLILGMYKSEGIPLNKTTLSTLRPFVMEVPLGQFANIKKGLGIGD
ncbi:MAG: FAD-dependent oxidoreductase [Elusimicrobia bacterium]|nr:FAD-dependent oxidoreductase [Elusimicrobiota bacterium]